jgi:hypothetical protein
MPVDGKEAALANKQEQEEEIKAWESLSKSFFVGKPFLISTKLYFLLSDLIQTICLPLSSKAISPRLVVHLQ